jgi:hypothetical protein
LQAQREGFRNEELMYGVMDRNAAISACKAPIRAAELAERMRRASALSDREQLIFTILMEERGNLDSQTMLHALNSAKIVFKHHHTILNA